VDRPEALLDYIASAADESLRVERWLGVTWALTARRMNDEAYFERCLSNAGASARLALSALPDLCDSARNGARSYAEWQDRTRSALAARR
jgi:hypothetical protein